VQVIQLTERLEEAEGGAESQVRLTILITHFEEVEGDAEGQVSVRISGFEESEGGPYNYFSNYGMSSEGEVRVDIHLQL
jgi:hypothetical protein